MAQRSTKGDIVKGSVTIPLEWHIPEDMPLAWANNFVIQSYEGCFVLSCFEVRRPIIVGSEEHVVSEIRKMKKVRAHCVARIAMTPEHMKELLEILGDRSRKALESELETSVTKDNGGDDYHASDEISD